MGNILIRSYGGVRSVVGVCSLLFVVSGCSVSDQALSELTGVSLTSTQTVVPPSVTIVSGNFQIVAPSNPYAEALRVQVMSGGTAVANETVYFSFTTAVTGTLSATTATTDVNGMAQVTLTAGASPGTMGIQASAIGATANFTQTVIDQSGHSIAIYSGNGQTTGVNANYTNPLKVLVTNNATTLPAPNIIVSFLVTAGNGKINGVSNTLNVTTDSFGVATISFQAGTIAGTDSVKAQIAANVGQNVTFSHTATTSAANFSLANSKVDTSLNGVIANGSDQSVITFTLKDAYNNILGAPTGTVVFTPTAGTMIGPVVNVGDGTYTQSWQAPATGSGTTVTISATYNAGAVTDTALISLSSGTYSISNSTITASTSTVTADGTSFTTVTVTLKDALGNQLMVGGETIVISKTGAMGSLEGSVSYIGNGQYQQVFKSSTATGTSNVTATVNAVGIPGSVSVNFVSGNASALTSILSSSLNIVPPNDSTTTLITLVTKDVNGNTRNSSSAGNPTVTFTSTKGTFVGSVINNMNGTYSQYLKSAVAGTAVVKAVIDGVTTTNSTTVYFNSQNSMPSTQYSVVEIVGGATLAPANGVAQVTVRAQIKTGANVSMGSGGNSVVFSTTGGNLIGSVTDVGDGTYTQVLEAPNTPVVGVTISATVDGGTITDTASLSYYGSMSLATSMLTAASNSIEANGTSTTLMILQAKDILGTVIPVGGEAGISFSTTNGTFTSNSTATSAAVDNGNGTYSLYLKSTLGSNTAVVTAYKSATPFSDSETVIFFTANNYAGVALDCTADCGGADFSTCPTSVLKRIRIYGNNNIVVDNGQLTINTRSSAGYCPNDFNFGSVILRNNGVVKHTAIGTGTTIYGVEFTANTLNIDSTSRIDLSGLGHAPLTANTCRVPGGTVANPSAADGTSGWASAAGLPCQYGGGSHGGEGGVYGPAYNYGGGTTHGSLYEPTDAGSAASYRVGGMGTAGGGRLKLTVTGTMTVDGYVSVTGANTALNNTGAGAGGSVWLNVGTLNGIGYISANGGNSTAASYPSGGGGGRIAVYYNALAGAFSYPTNVFSGLRAYGGYATTNSVYMAAAGTIYLKQTSQVYGDLLIDNNGTVPYVGSTLRPATTIAFPAIQTPDSVTAQQLTDVTMFKDPYRTDSSFKNWFIHANTTENATATRLDDTFQKITSADADNIYISAGSMTAAPVNANTGANYELFLIFDRIEIRGKAHVKGPHMIALSGSISNATSVTVAGGFGNNSGFEYDAVDLTIDTSSLNTASNPLSLDKVPFRTASKSLTLNNGSFTMSSPLNAAALTMSASTLTTSVTKGTQTLNLSGALSLSNSSTLSHSGASTTVAGPEYSMEITASSIAINDAGSSIHGDSGGYLSTTTYKCRTVGNKEVSDYVGNTLLSITSASHGGYGGHFYQTVYTTNKPYGSITNPYTLGASCHSTISGFGAATRGGGLVRLNLNNGTLLNNGRISANSAVGGTYYFTGAGGSVYINAGNINGTGSIQSNGANSAINWGGGGSGGRIAIYYDSLSGNFSYPTNVIANIKAKGGAGGHSGNNYYGASGTIFLKQKSALLGDLIVDNGGNQACLAGYAPRCGTTIGSPARAAIQTSPTATTAQFLSASQFQEEGENTNAVVGYYIVPNVNENGSSYLSAKTRYEVTGVSGTTITAANGNISSVAALGSTAAFPLVVRNLELTGGAVLYLTENIIVTEGDISSNDTTTFAATGSVQGTGVIELATNSNLNISNNNYAYNTGKFETSGSIASLTVGVSGKYVTASPLSVAGNLNVSGSFTSTSTVSVGGNVSVSGTGSMSLGTTGFTPSLVVTGDLTTSGSAVIYTNACTDTTVYRTYITANNITIGSGTSIDGQGRGYTPYAAGATRVETSVYVNGRYGQTNRYGGGSHGGSGGQANTAGSDSSDPFDSLFFPLHPGGSGAYESAVGTGTNGGAALRLGVTNTLTVDGTINMKGMDAPSAARPSTGAGGSVLIQTNTLTGTGSIDASGGALWSGIATYGGGGGGRVGVLYTTLGGNFTLPSNAITNIKAYGGTGGAASTQNGAAGTIYMKSATQSFGDLIVNNNNLSTSGAEVTTYIRTPVSNQISTLTSGNTVIGRVGQFGYNLNTSNAYVLTDKWFGFHINPKTDQNATTVLTDDTFYQINASTNDSVTVGADITAGIGAVASSNYRMVLKLDNLEVRGKGNLDAPNLNIQVLSGDLSSNDATTFNQDGMINANVVDIGGATWNGTANETGSIITNRCGVAGTIAINCP